MFSLRTLVMAAATLLIAACASDGYGSGYGGGYDGGYYPGGTDYGYDPDYGYGGYGYGYDDDNDNDHHRYFRPEHGVTCDRARHVCYDNDGRSYRETKQYFGKHDANEAFNRGGDGG